MQIPILVHLVQFKSISNDEDSVFHTKMSIIEQNILVGEGASFGANNSMINQQEFGQPFDSTCLALDSRTLESRGLNPSWLKNSSNNPTTRGHSKEVPHLFNNKNTLNTAQGERKHFPPTG